MPRVVFTPNLRRHIPCPETRVMGATVRESLEAVFFDNAKLRGYILDDQNRLRKHVVVFVNGVPIADRDSLSDPVEDNGEIYVMQALSGG